MRILSVGAHPDDVELLCAGTLAQYIDQGADVFVSVLTNGELGASSGSTLAETAKIRHGEAREAAALLGAKLIWLGLSDGFLFDTEETRKEAVNLLREVRPDLVLTHHPFDYHPDHRAAAQLIGAARILAREAAMETEFEPTGIITPLVYMDTVASVGTPPPDFWVDVTDTMPRKQAMLERHQSQNKHRRQRQGEDLSALMHDQATFRGGEVQVRYAEAFYFAASHPATDLSSLASPDQGIALPIIYGSHVDSIGGSPT